MLSELKKSTQAILNERIISPFWGSFIFSWLIWNWKIPYLTLFVSQDKVDGNKIDYITENLLGTRNLILYPLISTAIMLAVIPFFSNGAYWLYLKFRKWRKDQKNIIEKKELITLEQSVMLREEIINQENRLNGLLDSKTLEINQLKQIIDDLKQGKDKVISREGSNEAEISDHKIKSLLESVNGSDKRRGVLNAIMLGVQRGSDLSNSNTIDPHDLVYFESNNFIKPRGNGSYEFTTDGMKLFREYTKYRF